VPCDFCPQQIKTSPVKFHNGEKTKKLNNTFFSKMILLMNQGPVWSSLVKKIGGPKSRGIIPLSVGRRPYFMAGSPFVILEVI
jgi:hypothetical protein